MMDPRASPAESGFLTEDPSSCRQTPNGTFDNLYDSEENFKTVWEVPNMSYRNRLESISMDNVTDPQLTATSHVTQLHYPSSPNIPDSYLSLWIKKEPNPPEISEAESVRGASPEQEIFLGNSGETGDNEKKEKKSVRGASPEQEILIGNSGETGDNEKKKEKSVRGASPEQEIFLGNSGETGDNQKQERSGHAQCCPVSVPWCIVGVLVLVVVVVVVVLAVLLGSSSQGTGSGPQARGHIKTQDPRSGGPSCNESWIWVRGRCYFFSDEPKTWNDSQKFCTEHGSTLAVLIDPDIKKTIQRYRQNVNYWLGLSKNHEEQWMWTNGSLYDGQVENDDNHNLRCAYLNSHLGALDCSTGRQWICVKDST